MAGKKKKGGRVTESPWTAKRTVAKGIVQRFTSAGWLEADAEDIAAINAGELHVSKVCTCGPDEAEHVIGHAAGEHADQDHAVVVTLHEGPPVAVLVRPVE